jgi:predicted transcriptional regulator
MKTIQVRLPDHIHERLKELAKEEGISINRLIVSSVSNEVIRQETRDFFKKAAAAFDPKAFAEVLAAIPDKPVQESDKL